MNEEIKHLKSEIRELKRLNKILREEVVLNSIAASLCDRIDDALKGYRTEGESLDEAVIRLLEVLRKQDKIWRNGKVIRTKKV